MTTFQKQNLGKYILLDKLGADGLTELYRAMITGVEGFEKLIVIKKILPRLAIEAAPVRSFIDEAKLGALLHHQNIVQIHDFDSLGDNYFMAMEYLPGKDCRAVSGKAGAKNLPLELRHALLIVSRICAGLDYAHKLKDFRGTPLNIIHGCISPQNILITYEGDVKILGFGSAAAVNPTGMVQTGLTRDRAAYMSPEQAAGKDIDHRSDIFSCGIILYELVTGTRMFTGDTMRILSQVREARFASPEELENDLPEKLLTTLYKALAREPGQRYQSCGDMLTDLEGCMQQMGLPPTAHAFACYMKTLFADEIVAEEQHMQEITRIGLMQDAAETITSSLPRRDDATEPAASAVRRDDAVDGAESQPAGHLPPAHSKKSLYAAMVVAVLVVIALLATFISKEQEPRQPASGTVLESGSAPTAADSSQPLLPAGQEESLDDAPGTELYPQAMDALVTGRYQRAIDLFEKMLQLEPAKKDRIKVPFAEALVGQAEKITGTDVGKAAELLEKSISLNPDSEQAHFQLGMLYLKQKDYPRAIANYQSVIKLDPQFPDSYFNLGFIHALTRDYAKAEAMYAKTVELAPPYLDEALFNLALVQNKQGKTADSIANLEKAVTINPRNMPARTYLKKFQEASGEKQ